ncbi:hypothetical protein [Fibrobacter sp. UWH4]|nr:hypothetical protein [Fibrobacter sp. UWH4]SHL06408.1 hypothetical protein SAMN05720762_10492 [Fibrobacter sp. UWH4]
MSESKYPRTAENATERTSAQKNNDPNKKLLVCVDGRVFGINDIFKKGR